MRLYDTMTDVIKQGGTRRGANMADSSVMTILRSWIHTDEADSWRHGNFNVSVGVDAQFFQAVEADAEYDLINPHGRKTRRQDPAKAVFDAMVENAWKTGDPGYVVLGSNQRIGIRIRRPSSDGSRVRIHAVKQPLLPWEAVQSWEPQPFNFVAGDILSGRFDFPRLKEAVLLSTRFLEDVIEVNDYPLPEIERLAKGNRRIGLGVMGWAEALVTCGIPYDKDEALKLGDKVMSFISGAALEASESLAKERGIFPNWHGSAYDPASKHYRGQKLHPRIARARLSRPPERSPSPRACKVEELSLSSRLLIPATTRRR